MWGKLGRLLWRVGRYGEARAAYQEGAAAADERRLAARCYAAIGFLVSQGLQHQDEALSALDAAEKLLEHVTEQDSDQWGPLGHPSTRLALSPITGGTPSRQKRCSPGNGPCWKQEVRRLNEHRFTRTLAMSAPPSRYRVDESIVSDFRAAKAAAEGSLGANPRSLVPKWRTRVAGPIGILGLPCGGTGTSKPHWWSSVKR